MPPFPQAFRDAHPDAWSKIRLILAETLEAKLCTSTAMQTKNRNGGISSGTGSSSV